MTPADARTNSNSQKVRLFGNDSLSKTAAGEKWDRAKVVCTQPFNKSIAYGLSFISFLTDEGSKEESKKAERGSQKLGAFTLNDDTDSDSAPARNVGSVFSDRARLQADLPPPTAAAAVRAAARDADEKVGVKKPKAEPSSPATAKQNKEVNESSKKPSHKKDTPKEAKSSTSKPPRASDTKSPNEKDEKNKKDPEKPSSFSKATSSTSSSPAGSASSVPLKEIMKGVVFSLSGYKNPKRSDLREKGMEMGAKYNPDWDKKCTHLICAYEKTPKFTQVNGKGYIVTENWILDSHKQRTKLPWRNYRMGRSKTPPIDKKDSSSEHKAEPENKEDKSKKAQDEKPQQKAAAKKPDVRRGAIYDDSTDVDSEADEPPVKKVKTTEMRAPQESQDTDATDVDSMDTDDEIAAHLAKKASPNKGKSPANGKPSNVKSSIAGASRSMKQELPVLPDFLLDKTFFLYGNVDNRRRVYRYIFAYGGEVEEYMCDDVKYVITDDEWDDNFDSALNDNPNLIFVKSKWITDIHTKQKFVPHQKYAVVPN